MNMDIISSLISVIVTLGSLVFFMGKMNQKLDQSNQKDIAQDKLINTLFTKLDEKHEANYQKIELLQQFQNRTIPAVEHYERVEKELLGRINNLEQSMATVQQQISQAPTMKEVRDEFVSKEMFKQLEKHMDEKFTKLEKGIDEILKELRVK